MHEVLFQSDMRLQGSGMMAWVLMKVLLRSLCSWQAFALAIHLTFFIALFIFSPNSLIARLAICVAANVAHLLQDAYNISNHVGNETNFVVLRAYENSWLFLPAVVWSLWSQFTWGPRLLSSDLSLCICPKSPPFCLLCLASYSPCIVIICVNSLSMVDVTIVTPLQCSYLSWSSAKYWISSLVWLFNAQLCMLMNLPWCKLSLICIIKVGDYFIVNV